MWGLDVLGLAKFGDVAAKNWPEGWALGCFSNVDGFGDALPALEKVLKTGKVPRVRLQLCWRDNHDYSKSFASIQAEAKRCAAFAKKFPKVEWRFSGACEHLLTKTQAQKLCDIVLKEAPFVTYVNTPMNGTLLRPSKNVLNESHGKKMAGSRLDFSFDGSNCVDEDVESYKRQFHKAETFYFWACRFNLKWSMNDKTPRPDRKAIPDGKYLQSIIALAQPKGATTLPTGWLYKSHAERHNLADPKGDRPLFIAPMKTREIVLKDGAKVLARFAYYGTYAGGGHRYYCKTWGYEIASKPVSVCVGSKVFGKVNPAFRQGVYR